jgi:DNA-binding Lrp family transcriptional regulator
MEWMSKPGPKQRVSDDRIVWAIKQANGPAASTSEIAEEVGLSTTQTRERLGELKRANIVESKKFGSGKGWWVC